MSVESSSSSFTTRTKAQVFFAVPLRTKNPSVVKLLYFGVGSINVILFVFVRYVLSIGFIFPVKVCPLIVTGSVR